MSHLKLLFTIITFFCLINQHQAIHLNNVKNYNNETTSEKTQSKLKSNQSEDLLIQNGQNSLSIDSRMKILSHKELKLNLTKKYKRKNYIFTPEHKTNWTGLKAIQKKCKPGKIMDKIKKKCINVSAILQIDLNLPNLLIGNKTLVELRIDQQVFQKLNPKFKKIKCKEKQMFYDGQNCNKCEQKKILNLSDLKCTTCAANYLYNSTNRSCQAIKTPLTNLKSTFFVLPSNKTLSEAKQQQEGLLKNQTYTVCDMDYPFWNGSACIECQSKQLFFLETKKCGKCKNGSYFDINNHTCTQAQALQNIPITLPNLIIENIREFNIKQKVFKESHPDFNPVVCPSDTPYYNGSQCKACIKPYLYFNVSKLECQGCNTGQVYDKENLKCLKINPMIILNLSAPNLVKDFSVNLTELRQKQRIFIDQNPQFTKSNCQIIRPFYNGQDCISCPEDKPLFNITTLTCTVCQPLTKYNSTTLQCQYLEKIIIYQTDLSAENLLLGQAQTIPILRQGQQKQKITLGTQPLVQITSCNHSHPFSIGSQCISCGKQTPYFNFTAKKCTTCAANYLYNSTNRSCQAIKTPLTNLKSTFFVLPSNKTLSEAKQQQEGLLKNQTYTVCDMDYPFWNGSACIECQSKQLFFLETKKCGKCKNGSYFDINNHTCTQAQALQNIPITLPNLIIENIREFNIKQKVFKESHPDFNPVVCPSDTPYYNGSQCKACIKPYLYFNVTQNFCQSCNTEQIYDPEELKCSKIKPIMILNLKAPNIVKESNINVTELIIKQDALFKDHPQIIRKNCRTIRPFYNGQDCISCPEDKPLFNITTLTCTVCQPLTKYNSTTLQCQYLEKIIIYQTDLSAENLLLGQAQTIPILRQGQQKQKITLGTQPLVQITSCNHSHPFSIGSQCISCGKQTPYFNFTAKKCTTCAANYLYNSTNRSCQAIKTPLTNLKSTFFVLPSNKTLSEAKQQQEGLLKNQTYTVCDMDYPFWNGSACIECQSKQLFFLETKKCGKCKNGSYFDINNHTCTQAQALQNIPITLPNLIIENIREFNIKQKVFKESHPDFNPVVCPSDTPYYNGSQCKACIKPYLYFNVSKLECQGCNTGQVYDKENLKCLKINPMIILNLSAPNLVKDFSVNLTELRQKQRIFIDQNPQFTKSNCQIIRPFYNGQDCISCPEDKPLFNITTLTCTVCQPLTKYNSTTLQCQYLEKIIIYQTDLSAENLLLGQAQTIPILRQGQQKQKITLGTQPLVQITSCNHSHPFSIGSQCISCGKQTPYFNFTAKKCTTCAANYLYNSTNRSCQAIKTPLTNLKSTFFVLPSNKTLSEAKQQQEGLLKNQTYTVCDMDYPFWNGSACIECQSKQLFFLETKKCGKCKNGSYFDINNHTCTQAQALQNIPITLPNLIIENIREFNIKQKVFKESHPDFNPVVCPSDTPYYNGSQCKACIKPYLYFNVSKLECQGCNTGQVYDKENLKCLKINPMIILNLSAPNLVKDFSVNLTELRQKQRIFIDQNPQFTKSNCQIIRPFYNGQDCISCPEDKPLFNITTLTCTVCQPLTKYNSTTLQCQYLEKIIIYQTDLSAENLLLGQAQTIPILRQGQQKQKITLGTQPLVQITSCNHSHPFSIGSQCISCGKQTPYFNFTAKKCTTCAANYLYNSTNRSCQAIKTPLTNLKSTFFVLPSNKTLSEAKQQQEGLLKNQTYTVCDMDYPFWNGSACIECQSKQLFFLETKKCGKCKNGSYFDINNHTCTQAQALQNIPITLPNLIIENIREFNIKQKVFKESHPDFNPVVCPSDTPYYNGSQCKACIKPYLYFNVSKLECQGCNTGQVYDKENLKCLKINPMIILNLSAPNLVKDFSVNLTELRQKQRIFIDQNPQFTKSNCQIIRPFYNGQDCISCPEDKPLFNITTLTCTVCQPLTKYNSTTLQCQYLEKIIIYQTDLSAENLLLGQAQTIPILRQGQQKQKITLGTQPLVQITSCNHSHPFSIGSQCISCGKQTPYFNFTAKKCTTCAANYLYNSTNRSCQAIKTPLTNLKSTFFVLPSNKTLSEAKQQQEGLLKNQTYTVCDMDYPFWNGSACIECQSKQLFFLETKKCGKCKNGSYFDINNHTCTQAQALQNIPITLPNLIIENIREFNIKQKVFKESHPDFNPVVCPSDTPYYNGSQCKACIKPYLYFNVTQNFCQSCNTEQIYDPEELKCSKIKPIMILNLKAPNIVKESNINVTELIIKQDALFKDHPQIIRKNCRTIRPFYNGQDCISCPEDKPLFNITTLTCTVCQPLTKYNSTTLQCQYLEKIIIYQTDLSAENLLLGQAQTIPILRQGQQKQKITLGTQPLVQITSCNHSHPFSIGSQCISCGKQTPYFNFTAKKCTTCAANYLYNSTNRSCQAIKTPLTNLKSTFFVLPSNKTLSEAKQQQEGLLKNQTYTVCDMDYPFWNGSACIECQSKQLFFLETKKCGKCKNGSYFDINNHTCTQAQALQNIPITLPNLIIENIREFNIKQKVFKESHPDFNPVVCPSDTPYYNGSQCKACIKPYLYFNVTQNFCQSCNTEQIYDPEELKCSKIKPIMILNLKAPNIVKESNINVTELIIKQDALFKDHPQIIRKNCRTIRPFYNGQDCISCPEDKPLFNITTLTCTVCQPLTKYNSTTLQCQYLEKIIIYQTDLSAENLLLGQAQTIPILRQGQQKQKITLGTQPLVQITSCNHSHPFSIGSQCISCGKQTPYFNFTAKKCTTCAANYLYNSTNRSCQAIKTPLTNLKSTFFVLPSNKTLSEAKQQQEGLLKNQTYTVCDMDYPFWNGSACIECQSKQLFFLETKKCGKCKNGSYFDINNHTCTQAQALQNIPITLPNLIIENIREFNIKQKVFKESHPDFNPVVCPSDTPYYNGSQCKACIKPYLYFNVTQNFCQSCNTEQIYDPEELKCSKIKPIMILNLKAPNIVKESNINVTELIIKQDALFKDHPQIIRKNCRTIRPFYNGQDCISCPEDKPLFNITTLTCTVCQPLTKYNSTTLQCQYLEKIIIYQTDLSAENLLLGQAQTIPILRQGQQKQKITLGTQPLVQITSCNHSHPFSIGSQCISCGKQTPYFNFTAKKCTTCAANYLYNSTNRSCQAIKTPLTNLKSTFFVLPSNKTLSEAKQQQEGLLKNQTYTVCDMDYPFWNGSACIECQSKQLFFLETKKCGKCKNGSYFDINNHTCTQAQALQNIPITLPNLIIENIREFNIKQKVFKESHPDFNPVVCPSDTPYYNGSQCKACIKPYLYFNVTQNFCQSCNTEQIYDPEELKCSKIKPIMILNLKAPNIVKESNINVTELIIKQDALFKDHPQIIRKNCRTIRPFYNGQDCISCPEDKPLFNITTLTCTVCQPLTKYNSTTLQCQYLEKIIIYQTDLSAENLLLGQAQTIPILRQGQQKQKITLGTQPLVQITSCNHSHPFSIGSQCISCGKQTPYFNFTAKKCTTCAANYLYNSTNRSCQAIKTPLTNLKSTFFVLPSNKTLSEAKQQQEGLLKNQTYTVCDMDYPFWNGSACIECQSKQLFFLETKKCGKCKNGSYFDINNHTCTQAQALQNIPITLPNLIIENIREFNIKQKVFKESHPDFNPVVCPSDTPYYNGSQCKACIKPYLYFNVTQNFCQSCNTEQIYDPEELKCSKIKPIMILNLKAPNIVKESNINVTELIIKQDALFKDHPQIIRKNCRTIRPFYNGQDCISCPEDKPLFNITTLTCTVCQPLTKYNSTTLQCQYLEKIIIYQTDLSAENLLLGQAQTIPILRQGQQKQKITLGTQPLVQITSCNHSHPFSIGSQCISCGKQTPYFNFTAKKCTTCAANYLYNSTNRSCQAIKTPLTNLKSTFFVLPSNKTLSEAKQQQEGLLKNQTYTVCDMDYPFWNGSACIECQSKQLFFLETKKCGKCKNGSYFDINNHTCTQAQALQNIPITLPNLIIENIREFNIKQKVFKESHPDFNPVVCPSDTPYYNGSQCKACIKPYLYFNVTQNFCQSCNTEQIYDPEELKCSKIKPIMILNLKAPNIVKESNINVTELIIKQDALFKDHPQIIRKNCRTIRPFYNGQDCISCPEDKPLFNITTLTCTVCQPLTKYNSTTLQCQYLEKIIIYQTDLSAENLLLGQAQTIPILRQGQQKQKITLGTQPLVQITSCNHSHPFSIGSQCISCGKQTPYFNFTAKKCVLLPLGYFYNRQLHTFSQIDPINSINLLTSSVLIPNSTTIQYFISSQQLFNSTYPLANRIQCKSNQFLNKQFQCISCSSHVPLFDLTTYSCTNCKPSSIYNFLLKKCIELDLGSNQLIKPLGLHLSKKSTKSSSLFYSNIGQNIKWIASEPKKLQQGWLLINKKQLCPLYKPFSIKNKCVSCPPNSVFDFDRESCILIPKNRKYDHQYHKLV